MRLHPLRGSVKVLAAIGPIASPCSAARTMQIEGFFDNQALRRHRSRTFALKRIAPAALLGAARPSHFTAFAVFLNADPSTVDKSHRQLRLCVAGRCCSRQSPPPSRNSRMRRRRFRHRTRTHRHSRATAASTQISAVLSNYASREYRAKCLKPISPATYRSDAG